MNFFEFKGYSEELDNLSETNKSLLSSVIFSNRESSLSVCAVTRDLTTIKSICVGLTLPSYFFDPLFNRWGVDLESLRTDKIRFYCWLPKNNNIKLYGFYVDSQGRVYEKKIYKEGITIDRFDANNVMISHKEIEEVCSAEDWKGPAELVSIAQDNNYPVSFTRKVGKDQQYMIIHQKV